MPNGIGVIGPEFFAHRDDHGTAEHADRGLNDHKSVVGYPQAFEIPWLRIWIENIGFAQQTGAEHHQSSLDPNGPRSLPYRIHHGRSQKRRIQRKDEPDRVVENDRITGKEKQHREDPQGQKRSFSAVRNEKQ